MANKLKLCSAAIMFLTVVLCSIEIYSRFPNGSSNLYGSANEYKSNYSEAPVNQHIPVQLDISSKDKVVIAAVSCRNGSISPSNSKYNEQTLVMIKSVLISAQLFNIPVVELHLFLEHEAIDGLYFRKRLQEMGLDNDGPVQLILRVHSALKTVPEEYHEHMIYHHRFRCGYVRLFLHTALPNVDSIVYLDSDIIVTGNIGKHWEVLQKMTETQMIGLGYDRQPGNMEFLKRDEKLFGDIPRVPPRGVNSGVLIMNLTRMREYLWEEKLTRLYDDYSKLVPLTVQRTLNILLYYNQGLLRLIPCHLHFFSSTCEKGFYCEESLADPYGIHLIHGTASRFMEGEDFNGIYRYYQNFNLTNSEADVVKDVMEPIRQFYANASTPDVLHKKKNNCFGTLDKLLFKKFFNDSNTL